MDTPAFEIILPAKVFGSETKLLIFVDGKVERWQNGRLIPPMPGEVIVNRIPQLLANARSEQLA